MLFVVLICAANPNLQLYENEEIVWSFVEFTDNRPCLELIEGPQGIISLLDEQCSLRRAVDAVALTTCIYNAHKDHPAFSGVRTFFLKLLLPEYQPRTILIGLSLIQHL